MSLMAFRYSVALLLLVCANATSAALIGGSDTRFKWTHDSLTGIDWLNFEGGARPPTTRRSYLDVAAELEVGGDYEGWRFATRDEVWQFVHHATGLLLGPDTTETDYQGVTQGIAEYLGDTAAQHYGKWVGGSTADPGPTPGHHYVVGFFQLSILGVGDSYDVSEVSDTSVSALRGSWLVRGPQTVPEPTAISLAIVAVLGARVLRRHASSP